MREFCVFCYKATATNIVSNCEKDFYSTVENNVVNKFPKILERFSDASVENGHSDLNNLDKINGAKFLSCCDPCRVIVDTFCEDYHKLKCLEMVMEWKLKRLLGVMEYAGRVPSRWFKLQQHFGVQKFIEASNGRNDNILQHLKTYRDNIVKKCTKRLSQSQPRIILNRIDDKERSLTFSVSDSEFSAQLQDSSLSGDPRTFLRNVKVDDDKTIAENCLLFEEDKEYATTRKLKQDHNRDNGRTDDDHDSTGNKDTDSFQCNQCEKTYLTELKLKEHQRKVHCEPKYKCSTCEKVFQVRQTLWRHQIGHMDPVKWKHKCSICGRPFPTRYMTLRHMKTHEGIGDMNGISCQSILPPVPCPKCGKMFANEIRMKDHLGKYHVPRSLKCQKCPQRFKTRDDLRKHEVRAHTDRSTWKFKCCYCDMRFLYNCKLLSHVKTHHRDS